MFLINAFLILFVLSSMGEALPTFGFFGKSDTLKARVKEATPILKKYIYHTAAAYCPAPFPMERRQLLTVSESVPFANNDSETRGFLFVDPTESEIILSFRGTKHKKNWADNLDAKKVQFSSKDPEEGQVHKGFYEAYLSLRDQVKQILENATARFSGYSITFTGHSLGGAIASIALRDLMPSYPNSTARLVTYGMPRVGTKKWVETYPKVKVYRSVNKRDMVPSFPVDPPWEQDPFKHLPHAFLVKKSGRIRACDDENGKIDLKCVRLFAFSVKAHGTYHGIRTNCSSIINDSTNEE